MIPETIIATLAVMVFLLWFLVKVRKMGRWFLQKKLLAVGAFSTIFGGLLFAVSFIIGQFFPSMLLEEDLQFLIRMSIFLVFLGIVIILIDRIYRAWKKRLLLELEEERREYIEKVRYGLKIEEAEKIAKEHIKKATGKRTELIASKKEFKYWAIYLKDKDGIFYRVIIDQQGRVEEWESLKELPRYLFGI